jgi:hypothetical protein
MKLFLYSDDAATRDTVGIFKNRGYSCVRLTDKAAFFWQQLGGLGKADILVLQSHGDDDGPLLVDGQRGDSMTEKEVGQLINMLVAKDISLYLLSCHTGRGQFARKLAEDARAKWVAPVGFALVESGAGVCNAYSVEGNVHHGWVGTLVPPRHRLGKALSIP